MNNISKRRKDDIVIVVVHDRIKNDIIVKYLNDPALEIVKYNENDVLEKSFFNLIDSDSAAIIQDSLKNDLEWKNFEDIIAKMSVFNLKNSENVKIRVKIKVFPKQSDNSNLLEFELLIRNVSIMDKFTDFKVMNNFFSEDLDDKFGVLNYDTEVNELKLYIEFSYINSIECTICKVKLKERDAFYDSSDDIKTIINVIKSQIRESDKIGMINNHDIIITLFGCPVKHAKEVVERIYSAIILKVNIKFCISYFPIIEKVSLENVLNNLENTSKMLLK